MTSNPKQGNVPSLQVLGKHAWAAGNIVLFPFPLCVPVTPFTKPSATAPATVPLSSNTIYPRASIFGLGGCRTTGMYRVMKVRGSLWADRRDYRVNERQEIEAETT